MKHSWEADIAFQRVSHHQPFLASEAQEGNTIIIDPTLKEEAAMLGRVTIMVNPSKEVCAIHKAGGVGISSSQLFRCA